MTRDSKKLPYLLKLLEDESPLVQEAVLKELMAFGPALSEELTQMPEPPTVEERKRIQDLLDEYNQGSLRESWSSWFSLHGNCEQLEAAFTLLAQFQNRLADPACLKTLLDHLALEYKAMFTQIDVFQLANFLFKHKQLKGAESDYYDPLHSNLVTVIESRRGIPISLACIYMLVGWRLGLKIEGCNFPGHFLARVRLENQMFLVDCFNEGRFMEEDEILKKNKKAPDNLREILRTEADAFTIMVRVLHNLERAYQEKKQIGNVNLMLDLIKIIQES